MKKINNSDFKTKKKVILENAILHLLSPEIYPMPKLSLEDCAILMAKSPETIKSRLTLSKIEYSALTKMRSAFAKLGIFEISNL